MPASLGIRQGEYWAFVEGLKHPARRALIFDPGLSYEADIRIRLVDDPDGADIWTRRLKLPCKWDDLGDYKRRHPGRIVDHEPPPLPPAPAARVAISANELRRLVHEEVSKTLGVHRLSYSYPEAAVATGFSVGTLRNAVARNDLVPSYFNSKPVFTVEELGRWLSALPSEPRS